MRDPKLRTESPASGLTHGEDMLCLSQLSLRVCSSSSEEWGLVRLRPFTLERQLVLSVYRSCFGSHIVESSWVQLPCHIEKTVSQQTSCSTGSHSLSIPSVIVPEKWVWGWAAHVSARVGHPRVSVFLHSKQLMGYFCNWGSPKVGNWWHFGSILMVDLSTVMSGPKQYQNLLRIGLREMANLPLIQVWMKTVCRENVHCSFLFLYVYSLIALPYRESLPKLVKPASSMQLDTMNLPPPFRFIK